MMFISQKTRDHEYQSKKPSWYQKGQKQSHYRQTNEKDCDPNCTYTDKELIAQDQYGDLEIKTEPIEVDKRVKGSLEAEQVKAEAEYENKTKFKDNERLILSGNGKRTQTIHYIDQKCPQYKKKKQQNQSSGTNGNSSKSQPHKQSDSSKEKKGGEVLALVAVAAGGYVGSYFILKKSFEEEKQRPKREQRKAMGNVIVQTTCATGGAVGGGVYGASIGAVAGPVGAFIGAGLGMLAGSALGYGLKKIMPWNW